MMVSMKNDAGVVRLVKVGVSWTCFFFNGIPFFFRGMPIHGIVFLILAFCTFGFSNLIPTFLGNKWTAHYYLDRGYKPFGDGWDYARAKWRIASNQSEQSN